MRNKLQQRLVELENEYEKGRQLMAELEGKVDNTRDTLLRMAGAIQVIKEELEEDVVETMAEAD